MQAKIAQMFRRTTQKYGYLPKKQIIQHVETRIKMFRNWPINVRGILISPLHHGNGKEDKIECKLAKKQSSRTYKYRYGIFFHKENTFHGLIGKNKSRAQVKLLWEFLMLDTWSRLLKRYSSYLAPPISLSAPHPVKIENDHELIMTFCSGTSLPRLFGVPNSHKHHLMIPGREESVPLFLSLAYYLGAVARVKENEELLHGDFVPRHIIFDFNGELPFEIANVRVQFIEKPLPQLPVLSVIDVENSVPSVAKNVREENEKLLELIRKQIRGAYSIKNFDRYVADGFDHVGKHNVLSEVIAEQRESLGFSIEELI